MNWEEHRREKLTKERAEKIANADRVILTEENISVVAKKTGRSEYELTKYLAEAKERGGTCSVRIPSES